MFFIVELKSIGQQGLSLSPIIIINHWVSNDELAVNIVYCYDFQLVESGAWNSNFFSCYIRHNFSQIDLFSKIKTYMNSSDMYQLKYELEISCWGIHDALSSEK